MTFTTFNYNVLIDKIGKLDKAYSRNQKRYSILDEPSSDKTKPEMNSLQKLLGKVGDKVVSASTDMVTERQVFQNLMKELEPFEKEHQEKNTKETEEKMLNATLFLLGALIHRYYRIIYDYENYNKYNPFRFYKEIWNTKNCRLFMVIKEVLEVDKKNLDELTIVNALEVFQENMLRPVEVDEGKDNIKKKVVKPRYKTYEHFDRVDPHFIRNLEDMISEHKKQGKRLIDRFKAIRYLQSLAIELDKENQFVESEIIAWCTILKKAHPDFNSLNPETLELHIIKYFGLKPNQEEIKNRVIDLLAMSVKSGKLNGIKSHEEFLELLKTFNTDESRIILCGGFILLLEKKLDDGFYKVIEMSLGLETKLTINDRFECVKLLDEYSGREPAPNLNCEFFDSSENMKSEISQCLVALKRALPEEHHNTALTFS